MKVYQVTAVKTSSTQPEPKTHDESSLSNESLGDGVKSAAPRQPSIEASTVASDVITEAKQPSSHGIHLPRRLFRRTSQAMAKKGRQMARLRLSLTRSDANRRLVLKSGESNVRLRHFENRKQKFFADWFTTLVDMHWRWHVIGFIAIFVVTWLIFGALWLAISKRSTISTDEGVVQCVENIDNFASALLFSMETQMTVGYGHRYPEECMSALLVLFIQISIGLLIQCIITGLTFVKLLRPKKRSRTILFSDKAVICKRDNCYCLLFRVGDLRRSHMVGTSIRALMVRNRLTQEGESIPLCHYPVELETETTRSDGFIFLKWPITVVHWIKDESSPLWDLNADDLFGRVHFEIIVALEGTVESTGMLTQVRTSYVTSEVLWGEQLAPLVTYESTNGHYEIDFEHFHKTLPCRSMPTCSASEWNNLHPQHHHHHHFQPTTASSRPSSRPSSHATRLRRLSEISLASENDEDSFDEDDCQSGFTTPAVAMVTTYSDDEFKSKTYGDVTRRRSKRQRRFFPIAHPDDTIPISRRESNTSELSIELSLCHRYKM